MIVNLSMKILYCLPLLYNSGGIERIVTAKANWFVEHGHEVVMALSDNKKRNPYFPLNPKIRIYELNVNYLDDMGCHPLKWHVNQKKRKRLHKSALNDVIQKENPDVAISVFAEESKFLYDIRHSCRKIIEFHFTRYHKVYSGRQGLRRMLDRWRTFAAGRLVAKYDDFVVLTERDKQSWPKLDNIHVIPNFIVNKPEGIADCKQKRVVAFGRLAHQKGFDRLVDIWQKVCYDFPDWRLDVYGSGEDEVSLTEYSESLIKNGSLVFHKPVTDVYREMQKSSIYVMSSRYEGFPMVLLEASSVGLPCISFDIDCGPSDIIEDGKNGFLVPDGCVDLFAERLRKLMTDENLRIGMSREMKKVSEKFSSTAVMKKWERLIEG